MELIDGAELKKNIESTICNGCEIGHVVTPCGRCSITNVLMHIDRMEKIDAHPVRRGKWITTQKTIDDGITTCSYCHREFYIDDLAQVGNAAGFCEFCPACGAMMNGDANEQI